MERLYLVFLLTIFINLINTLTRSSRLAGVRTGRLATALSLFGVVYLAANFANTLQAPLLASTVDQTIVQTYAQAQLAEPDAVVIETAIYQHMLTDLNWKLRFVILGASLGTVLGVCLLPSFITSFSRAIEAFARTGSVFRVIGLFFLSPFQRGNGILRFRLVSLATLKGMLFRKIHTPPSFLIWSLVSYSLWTVNILAGFYACALYPEFRSTAVLMAAIVGNASIVLNLMMVDPVLGKVTDAVAAGEQDELELKQIIFCLALSNVGGTLLSQIIFEPVAQGLHILTRWIS